MDTFYQTAPSLVYAVSIVLSDKVLKFFPY